ncbi:GNAT family N-acetyltransferase [Pseudoduganella buxea]|uniref:N-acetyltransferase n=1 Tax=Pseudoduganella buxea TaxID=1949069 RepID=A0A6I3SXI0_9BURK|nr:GNAT family N-acetyltransferase [Pseudoduganella buxea]MTV53930.1 GNAT family N-acetyltransferase [Pseudoduganella buxea]GGC03554.1 N-acetyltransferase [Pseudoduganella buxea]
MIETERLLLRPWRDEDVAPFVAMNEVPAVIEHLPGPVTAAQARAFFDAQNALVDRTGTAFLAMSLKATDELIGFVGVRYQDFDTPFAPCHEIGWRLALPHWGRGLALEGAVAALRHGFDTLGLDEIVAITVPANVRSRRLMTRLGMVHDVNGDFDHPALPREHRLARHVLYRIGKDAVIPAALPPAAG